MVLSVFCDEAGQQDMSAGYYLITLVLHDQADTLDPFMDHYGSQLGASGLPDIPFHMVDLLQGHDDYEGMSLADRKRLLTYFGVFVRKAPVRYRTFAYRKFDVSNAELLSGRMRRDIVDFIYEHLEWFQGYDLVPVYYDEGQQVVTKALHRAFDYMLPGGHVEYKHLRYQDRRLAQVADYLCSIELAAMRYEQGEESSTYLKFYGTRGTFKKNWLKQARRKLLV